MKDRLLNLWETLSSRLWLVPSFMAVCAILLALATLQLDRYLQLTEKLHPMWLFTGSPEAARSIVSTIAGSMITVTGLAFSITMVSFTLASSQFGPRLLRNFIRDRGTQMVLGTFVSTFIYAVFIIREITNWEGNVYVPHISVSIAILLSLVSLGVLIYFIHHAALSIEIDQIVSNIHSELNASIERIYPKPDEDPDGNAELDEEVLDERFGTEGLLVCSNNWGYIQTVDYSELVALAGEYDIAIRLFHRPGHFIPRGEPIVSVVPGTALSEELIRRINTAFVLGIRRTPTQDVEYTVDQMVEIAVLALSPGVNEPFTAIACIDRLTDSLCRLVNRKTPNRYYFQDDMLRLVTIRFTFSDVLDAAFNQIRQFGKDNIAVSIHLLEALGMIARQATGEPARNAIRRHAAMVAEGSRHALFAEEDKKDIAERYRSVILMLDDKNA